MQRMAREASLLVYCGHGAGEAYLRRDVVMRDVAGAAAALLMGCSSAACTPTAEWDGEADGPVLAYLLSGSPVVVGALWDVTDKDIDRYTAALMAAAVRSAEEALVGDGAGADVGGASARAEGAARMRSLLRQLPALVAAQRGVCKLPGLTGAAPVAHGWGAPCG